MLGCGLASSRSLAEITRIYYVITTDANGSKGQDALKSPSSEGPPTSLFQKLEM